MGKTEPVAAVIGRSSNEARSARSNVMRAIKSKGTALEREFFGHLLAARLKSLKFHPLGVFGRPDAILETERIAIFVDSCFWHACPKHLRTPTANREYWTNKLSRNRRRDRCVTRVLRGQGWQVIRCWEHGLKSDADITRVVARIRKAIVARRR
jgi:DNA mismatch endonuclease (patch repair protein)